MKKKLLILWALLFGIFSYSQTTIVTQFNFNSTATALNPTVNNTIGLPFNMKLFNASNVQTAPSVVGGMLELSTVQEGSYLELEFNATNFSDLNVDFYGELANTIFGSGKWTLQEYNSTSGNYTPLGSLSLNFLNKGNTLNRNLSANANNNPSVKIRIVAEEIDQLILASKLRLDNLVITSKSPKINVFGYNTSNALQQIVVNAPAATSYGTDFGIVVTENPAAATRTFRISNTGTAALQISSINFTGDNPDDFSWVTNPATPVPIPVPTNPINSLPITINTGAYKEFIVKFNPSEEGKRSALLNISSNANPSPFSYYVEGRGATCKTEDLVLKRNTFETSQPASELLAANLVSGTFNIISGNSMANNTTNSNNLGSGNGTRLYCQVDTNFPLYTSSNKSWYVRNSTSTMEFGPVNVANEKGVYISFNLAAFSTAIGTDFNTNDYVELQVLKPGTTGAAPSDWSPELRVRGGTASNGNSRYSFNGGATATTLYDGDNTAVLFTNGNNLASKHAKVQLKLPGTANFQNVIFRIVASNGSDEKLWLIDDVAVYSANAVFRTYKADGTWRDSGNNIVAVPNEATQTYKNFKAIFENTYTVPPTGITICECEVKEGVSLTIPANTKLTVQRGIINNGNGSNFIINDGGNLLQVEDGAENTGNITAQKVFTFSSGRQQYNFVSSPTVDTNVKSIYTGVLDNSLSALYYIESNDRFGVSGGNYIAGRALALKEKSTGTEGGTSGNPAKFQGVPFNGIVNYPLAFTDVTHGYNLVGNPYPSNLDMENLYNSNTTKIDATFYFWDNRGNTQYTQQGSGYSGDNYAKYNAVAATGTGSGTKATGAPDATRVPNRYVKVGTGFLVQAKSAGKTLDFNNTMRSSNNSGPGFLGKSTQNEMKDRYWLTLKTPTDMEFMNAVVYLPNGSKAIGPEDTETFGGSDDIFTIVNDKNLNIQGRDQFEINDRLDLGVSLFQTGMHTISIYDAEGIFANGQSIYLKDKLTGTITNLSQGSYTFEANKGVTNARFEIIYKPETVLVTDSKVKDAIVVYRDSDHFVVKAPKIIATVEVYDLSGKMITVLKANSNLAVLNAAFFTKGMYVLRIKTIDGEITNKKIVKQ
ncbi:MULTISPECIES: choice-of-anchor D domain-containing protein [unclassified Kaistella]|uniref:choice-of-anchor D domain-containing protein n=1 Tax=unclassified Kaistella TaxID=2762626 RepID=UPI002735D485|nr:MULTISPECIES: choice-of-anchor D domain-containing protein [unclassified Kaistella]MDP2453801.1 choice-of-anchor D domain-containing protein [Kaistella sp. SH11-4b]MDP2456858.1 choice-of-anchor D domain-containing protein [Kaistella sp. SH40-3]MDP2459614.1 choice-of-anchor D domain-containing protein [Kaistella sp. SH19-2b]